MPLKKISVFITFLFIFTLSLSIYAQPVEPKSTTLADLKNADPPKTPTSAEIMRSRISRAKAYLVIKNYGAAIYELENIRQETSDKTVHRVLNVLLMHAYLEQGDYKKAQRFLKELHKAKGTTASIDYLAVAGQVVNGANTLSERYKSLGLSFSDRNLPIEATSDIENMRKTLELVVTQSKALSKNKRASSNAFALLEETSSIRSVLAKDAFDAKRWKDEVASAREQIVNPNSRIIDAVDNPPITSPNPNIVAANEVKLEPVEVDDRTDTKKEDGQDFDSVKKEDETQAKPTENTIAKDDPVRPKDRPIKIIKSDKKKAPKKTKKDDQPKIKSTDRPKKETKKPIENNVAKNENNSVDDGLPLAVGSLIGYATKRVNPVYPRQARTMRQSGTVTVEVIVDEKGKVRKVQNAEGPSLLKRAAKNAVKRWRFKPFERNGQPVEAKGFVSFNFDL